MRRVYLKISSRSSLFTWQPTGFTHIRTRIATLRRPINNYGPSMTVGHTNSNCDALNLKATCRSHGRTLSVKCCVTRSPCPGFRLYSECVVPIFRTSRYDKRVIRLRIMAACAGLLVLLCFHRHSAAIPWAVTRNLWKEPSLTIIIYHFTNNLRRSIPIRMSRFFFTTAFVGEIIYSAYILLIKLIKCKTIDEKETTILTKSRHYYCALSGR